MKYIANIVGTKSFDDNSKLFNVVSTISEIKNGIPTLIIGWEFTKSIYPDANILDWKIDNNTYWTFGNRERKNKHDADIIRFKDIAINRFLKSVQYTFFNIFTATSLEKKEIISMIEDGGNCSYINNNMLYIYNEAKGRIYGISLLDVEYKGKRAEDILSKIYSSGNVIQSKDIPVNTRYALRESNYIIPYLYY